MGKPYIVAELSANHNQNIGVALATIKAAKDAGADAVKIQTYTPDTITLKCSNKYFQINAGTIWDGVTLYELYEKAYTPWEWHEELFGYAKEIGIEIFSSPFDISAIDLLESIDVTRYKIASLEITDIPLIEYAASKGKPMIISTGIATTQDIVEAIQACKRKGITDITLLQCTSQYPANYKDANLLTMVNMKERFKVKTGVSDHTIGSEVPTVATVLGAEMIEKHFILDRELGGPDASFSMTPPDFKDMVARVRNAKEIMGDVTYELTEMKKTSREFARSLFVVEDVKRGDIITKDNIRSIRPGHGISPKYYEEILGKKFAKDTERGTPVSWDILENGKELD